jgi:hypothetical protein
VGIYRNSRLTRSGIPNDLTSAVYRMRIIGRRIIQNGSGGGLRDVKDVGPFLDFLAVVGVVKCGVYSPVPKQHLRSRTSVSDKDVSIESCKKC